MDVTPAQTSGGTGVYIGRREQLREIVANISMNPNYFVGETVEALREELYLMNPVNEDASWIRLMFEGAEVAIASSLLRVETAVFSKDTILQLVLGIHASGSSEGIPYLSRYYGILMHLDSCCAIFKLIIL